MTAPSPLLSEGLARHCNVANKFSSAQLVGQQNKIKRGFITALQNCLKKMNFLPGSLRTFVKFLFSEKFPRLSITSTTLRTMLTLGLATSI